MEIQKQIQPAITSAKSLAIKDQESMIIATDTLSNLNKLKDKVTEEKEKITKPLNEALKNERARWKPLEDELEEAIKHIRGSMTQYQTAIFLKQKEEEAKLAKKLASGKIKVDTAIAKMSELEEAKSQEKVSTASGSVSFRTSYQIHITKASDIPREYLAPDEAKILSVLKTGIKIKGVELLELKTPINRRA